MILRLVVAAAAVGSVAIQTSPAAAVAALAVNKCGAYGFTFDQPTREAANRAALQKCQGEGCHVVQTVVRYCAAFAWDADNHCGAQGWASGQTRGAAEAAAIAQCSGFGGGNCVTRTWVCDAGH